MGRESEVITGFLFLMRCKSSCIYLQSRSVSLGETEREEMIIVRQGVSAEWEASSLILLLISFCSLLFVARSFLLL